MVLSHNQMAYAAIVSTLIFGSLFVGASGFFQTSEDFGDFESAADDDITGGGTNAQDALDTDGDGIPDTLETSQYGTLPNNPDTDGDGMSDGWEIANGLNPNDNGLSDDETNDPSQADTEEAEIEEETNALPDPDDGPGGDPDRDGLINSLEQELGTDPRRADTDSDGLGDKWESEHTYIEQGPTSEIVMFDPLSGNWDCELLTASKITEFESRFDGKEGRADAEDMKSALDEYSCDMILDSDQDSLYNFEEEAYGTNPRAKDSDGDKLDDVFEISSVAMAFKYPLGSSECLTTELIVPIIKSPPFLDQAVNIGISWFLEDMDGDGYKNGPSDFDTDGDGMPDGFEYCFSKHENHPEYNSNPGKAFEELLSPVNLSDAFGDWDNDGMNNIEEYEVSFNFNFTNPWQVDSDNDQMPDGWEASMGLDPTFRFNADLDPDMDGYDIDGDGSVTYPQLEVDLTIISIDVDLGELVSANQTVARGQVVLSGGNQKIVPIVAPIRGYVNNISIAVGSVISVNTDVMMVIVEDNDPIYGDERFTNLEEYWAKYENGIPVNSQNQPNPVIGRSTDPMDADTDNDGLMDGIEVMGWEILVVNRGVVRTWVTSNPGQIDTDLDGLSDYYEYGEVCAQGSNASNADTDGDGLQDRVEALDGHQAPPNYKDNLRYYTDPCMFDTDNDGLEDGEEVSLGVDNFYTHANDSDTDDDGLQDGDEMINIPRPWQRPTNPTVNDTDNDGMMDGWEMQVLSAEDNSRSHSLWVATDVWLPPNCDSLIECGKEPGGWLWLNWVGMFYPIKMYELNEMNLTNFNVPENSLCNCYGRWALDPNSLLTDTGYDIDNDSLPNDAELPSAWNTNPIDFDSDGDQLPDGWEVRFSLMAVEFGLYQNGTNEVGSARGIMDPSMIDSDLDGIEDGLEDLDNDGLNRSGLINKYCPGYGTSSSNCHINPDTPDGKSFYDNLENYTNYEEWENGTYPITNDTDGDQLEDGPEVYYQDHDDDGMATGWEYYFGFDPFDPADRLIDKDQDGHVNYCEYKWDTNPLDPTSFPSQNQLCDVYD